MKKLLLTFILVLTAGLAFASTKEEIAKDMQVYSTDIEPKLLEALGKIEQETIVIDKILDNKAKGSVDTSLKIVNNFSKAAVKHMSDNTHKLKTKEVKDYHLLSIQFIQLSNEFITEAVTSYKKYGQMTEKEKIRLQNKYGKQMEELNKKNAAILQKIQEMVH